MTRRLFFKLAESFAEHALIVAYAACAGCCMGALVFLDGGLSGLAAAVAWVTAVPIFLLVVIIADAFEQTLIGTRKS